MKLRTRAGVALLLAGLFAFDASPCLACSCVEFTKRGYTDFADVIFKGKVLDVRSGVGFNERTAQRLLGANGFVLNFGEVVFQVETALKGHVWRRQVVVGAGSEASCGFEFQPGKTYTVFAKYRHGYLETSLCSGTVEGVIEPADYGLSPEQANNLRAPELVDGIDENQPYGHARWIVLVLVITSSVTAAVLIRCLVAAARRFPFFK